MIKLAVDAAHIGKPGLLHEALELSEPVAATHLYPVSSAKLSRDSLYEFELARPGAPSLDPRFRTADGQNH
jgi:hypothetical protein